MKPIQGFRFFYSTYERKHQLGLFSTTIGFSEGMHLAQHIENMTNHNPKLEKVFAFF